MRLHNHELITHILNAMDEDSFSIINKKIIPDGVDHLRCDDLH